MSGFDLVPLCGGDPVPVPPGLTVLGRGPLLGVTDKRVSRQHGLLENLDGRLRLKSTHLNPCFVQSSPTDDPRPLQRDSWVHLHHGDLVSLLPGQLVYRVESTGGEDQTPINSQMFEEGEEEEDVEPPPPPPPPDCDETPRCEEAALPEAVLDKDAAAAKSLNQGRHGDVAAPAVRRRVLPAWMMAAVAAPRTASSSPKVQSVKRSKAPAAPPTNGKRATPEGAELRPEEQPKKRKRRRSDEGGAASDTVECDVLSLQDVSSDWPSARLQLQSDRSEVSHESDSVAMETDDRGRGGVTSTADLNPATPPSATGRPENDGEKPRVRPGARVRAPCPYGKDCYRKNPLHFQESSHPGDTDYEEEDDDGDEEDLPECPYGTDCYRKNPLHRKEYKHTQKPASRRAAAAAYEEDDEDSGGDDSFIDDDSGDGGDDSDYVPPGSDDSGKEDIKVLQREAKAFLKRRK